MDSVPEHKGARGKTSYLIAVYTSKDKILGDRSGLFALGGVYLPPLYTRYLVLYDAASSLGTGTTGTRAVI